MVAGLADSFVHMYVVGCGDIGMVDGGTVGVSGANGRFTGDGGFVDGSNVCRGVGNGCGGGRRYYINDGMAGCRRDRSL